MNQVRNEEKHLFMKQKVLFSVSGEEGIHGITAKWKFPGIEPLSVCSPVQASAGSLPESHRSESSC